MNQARRRRSADVDAAKTRRASNVRRRRCVDPLAVCRGRDLPTPTLLAASVHAVVAHRTRRPSRRRGLATAARFGGILRTFEVGLVVGRGSAIPNDGCAHDSLLVAFAVCASPPVGRRAAQAAQKPIAARALASWVKAGRVPIDDAEESRAARRFRRGGYARRDRITASAAAFGPLHRIEEAPRGDNCVMSAKPRTCGAFHRIGESSTVC